MNKKINRNYLEISSIEELNESSNGFDKYSLKFLDKPDFQLNKFFYRNVGKKYHWVDRLGWTENQWIKYTSDKKLKTYVLKKACVRI